MSEVVTVLMPKISDPEVFTVRYRGLESQLGQMGVQPTFAQGQASYQEKTHNFDEHFSANRQPVQGVNPADIAAVRDLTIPKDFDRPIYKDPQAPLLVHKPELNAFLRDKSNLFDDLPGLHPESVVVPKDEVMTAAQMICGRNVVVKPVSGMASKGVYIGPLADMPRSMEDGNYLVQEYIDTSGGIPELGIQGVHNLRVLSIDSKIIGAVGRLKGEEGLFLRNDVYGKVYLPEQLPESMFKIAGSVQNLLKTKPGDGRNVIGIDLMRGVDSKGNEVDVICEVNHRPFRISEHDLLENQEDPKGIKWLANQWDFAEASMLAEMATAQA